MRSTLHALALFLATASLAPAYAATAAPAGMAPFEGKWSYADQKKFGHFADIAVEAGAGAEAAGHWSDGTRVAGSSGDLRGRLDGKKLYVRFCTDEAERGSTQCPAFDPDESAYLVRAGDKLVWYRKFGEGKTSEYKKYLELHRDERR
ncbi:hypothetical protein [Bordetella sp. N]|uniref:hypothetical protein n=1 Tax=Bordetella sp. N TaxID=1746199 RepID=UPI00070C6B4D|nr:hypothetical protein [Bordetella sp. N]ALM84054.1 hypothetical protein ASB57_14695 [Bordetella sp. N]